jgi:hypothetical protein
MTDTKNWPSWRYGPKGEAQVFNSPGEVPTGWLEHPSLHEKGMSAHGWPFDPTLHAATKIAPAGRGDAGQVVQSVDQDAHGWPFDPTLHAATKTKTKDGLWRMKVGVKRPDAKPGYPLDL